MKRVEMGREIMVFEGGAGTARVVVPDGMEVAFQSALPELQRFFQNGLMPIEVAGRTGFPVAVVSELFKRLATIEQFGLPLPYCVPEYCIEPIEMQQEKPAFSNVSRQATAGVLMVGAAVGVLFLAKTLLFDVVLVWVVAFAAGVAVAVKWIGGLAAVVFCGWLAAQILTEKRQGVGSKNAHPADAVAGGIHVSVNINSLNNN